MLGLGVLRAALERKEDLVHRPATLIGFALLLTLGAGALGASCTLSPLPCTGSDCKTAGSGGGGSSPYEPTAPVDVRRDHLGVVHVYGKTDGDALYGDGYMQATDRLFQMDLQRRHAAGRQSEVLGASTKGDDRVVRVMGIAQRGHENALAMKMAHPETYRSIEAWLAGVNTRIAEVKSGKAPMPSGFTELGYLPEEWTIDDVFAVGKLIVFGNGNQLQFDVLATAIKMFAPQLFEKLPLFEPLVNEFVLETANGPLASISPERSSSTTQHRPSAHVARSSRRELSPSLPSDAGERLERFTALMSHFAPKASNNFAVDGRHTLSGHSLIAGDPHQGLRSPSLMWLHHINSADAGGSLDVEGWSFVGTPGVSLGHNRDIAWTATTNYPDVTDLWDVAVDDQKNAMIGGTSVPIVERIESYTVKDQGTVEIVVQEVPGYGIILPDDLIPLPLVASGHHVLFNWTGFRPTNEAHAFMKMDLATNLDEFDAAVDQFELGSFNLVAASRDEITYRSSPLVPDRGVPSAHAPSYYMLNGDDPSSFWTGLFLTGDELPHSRGIASGIIVTANNDPFGFTKDGSLENDPFYFGAYYDPGTRSKRIHDVIASTVQTKKLTETDLESLQTDTHSLVADELIPLLDASYAKVPTAPTLAAYKNRPDLDALVALLDGWDRRMERTETAPVAFEGFMYFLTRDVIADDMGIFFDPVMSEQPIYVIKYALLALRDPASKFVQGEKDPTVLKALDETSAWLTAQYGHPDSGFVWSDFHATTFSSESLASLDGGSVPTDGGEGTVNVSSANFFDKSQNPLASHRSGDGPIYRMVASFDDAGLPHAFFDMPRGNVGEPSNSHFDDLTSDWVEDRYQPLLFSNQEIEADTTERVTIAP